MLANKNIDQLLEKNIELQQKLLQSENQLKLCKSQFEIDTKNMSLANDEKLKKFKEAEIKLNLNLNSSLNENKFLKNELISLKMVKTDLETELRAAKEKLDQANEQFEKVNVHVSNWQYKYKLLHQNCKELENLENKINLKTKSVVEENEKLKLMYKHHNCIINMVKAEHEESIKDFNAKLSKKEEELKELLIKINQLTNENELLSETNHQDKDKMEKLKLELEFIDKQKNDLIDQLNKANQTITLNAQFIIDQKRLEKSREGDLDEKAKLISTIESEKKILSDELNNLKISYDYQINELKQQLKNLNVNFKNEVDEKTDLKSKLNELKEQSYLSQLNLNDLMDEMKKIKSKRLYDNFTQTMPNFNQIELKNKICQTEQSFLTNTKQAFTQTVQPSTRSCVTQTDSVETQRQPNVPSLALKARNNNILNYQPVKPVNITKSLNNMLNETFDEDQYDLDGYFNQENLPSTSSNKNSSLERQVLENEVNKKINEFKNKNLAYKNDDKGLNEMFKNSIGDQKFKKNDSTRQASNSNQRKPSEDEGMDRNKSVKRVRFSETRLEIDQED